MGASPGDRRSGEQEPRQGRLNGATGDTAAAASLNRPGGLPEEGVLPFPRLDPRSPRSLGPAPGATGQTPWRAQEPEETQAARSGSVGAEAFLSRM